MVEFDQEELICLYLRNQSYDTSQSTVPAAITAAGIGDALELGESAASRIQLLNTLSELEENGLVLSEEHSVRGHDTPRTIYLLTDNGIEFASEVHDRFRETNVIITNGTTEEIPLEEINQYLTDSKAPIATALARLTDDGRVPLDQTVGDRFVDRTEALEQLQDAIEESFTRDSRTTLVSGPAGIGKTALVEAAFEEVLEAHPELATVRGDCPPGPTTSYGPLRRAFETLPEGRALSERLREAQEAPPTDDPEEVQNQREALFDDVADILRETSLSQPVVLFLDNLQWADKGTLDLFEHLAMSIDELLYPVAFVGTYRSPEVAAADSHPLASAISSMAEADSFQEINIKSLARNDVRALLAGVIGTQRLSEDFVDMVYDQTGGNPLFVRETATHLLEIGAVVPEEDRFPQSKEAVSLPGEISEQIDQRLTQLDAESRELLELGAVIGDHIPVQVLLRAADLDTNRAKEYLDILIASHVLESGSRPRSSDGPEETEAQLAADGSGDVRFVSGGIREAIIDKLQSDVSREYNARIADAFVSTYSDGELDQWSARVAYHFDQAEQPDRALAYFRRAGEYAVSIYAHDQAIEHYERAIEIARDIEAEGNRERAALWTELANVHKSKGDPDSVIDTAKQGLAIAPEDSEERCQLLGDRAWAEATRGQYNEAQTTARRQLELAKELNVRSQQAEALLMLGFTLVQTGDYGSARAELEQSLTIHRELDDRAGEAACLDTLGRLSMWQGELESAREYCERGLDIVEEVEDQQKEAELLNILGMVASKQNNLDEALERLQRSLEIHRDIDNRVGESVTLNNLGRLAVEAGNYEQASEYFERTLAIKREIGARQGEAVALVNLGHIALMQGRYEQARDRHEQSIEIVRDIEHVRLEIENLRLSGQIALEQGHLAEARDQLETALDIASDSENRELEAKTVRTYGALARRDGEYEDAAGYLQQAYETFQQLDEQAGLAQTRLLLAELARDRNDIEDARDHVVSAIEIFEELGMVHWLGRSQSVLGDIDCESGNRETAQEYWSSALEIFEQTGAPQDALATLQSFIASCRENGALEQAEELCQDAEEILERAPRSTVELFARWFRDCREKLSGDTIE